MTPVYATLDDLVAHLGVSDPPPNADRWLWRASRDVDVMLRTAMYEVDGSGLPVDPRQREAVRIATCEQAALLMELDDPTGARRRFQKVKIQHLEYHHVVDKGSGRPIVPRYSDRAVEVLRQAGLLPGVVYVP